MVFGIKGPKELLAAAIAAALAEYFEVDPTKIESNLMVDAKIVLRNVKLRSQVSDLQPDPNKDVVVMTTTGTVQEVAFTWSWALSGSSKKKSDSDSDNNSWVRDAVLAINGLEFKTQLSFGDKEAQNKIKRGLPAKSSSSKKLETIRKEGKLEAYVRDQVEQIIDALTLNVTEFNFTLALPQQEGTSSDISVGGRSIELRSLGRLFDATVGDKGSLKQQLSLGSFYANVRTLIEGQQKASTYPLLTPLSYRAVATRRTGKRFSSFGSGLECIGEPLPSSRGISDSLKDEGLVFHAGSVQMDVLTRLGNIILASPSSPVNEEDKTSSKADVTSNDSSSPNDQLESLKQEILTSSVFKFPISGISLVLPNETKCTLDKFILNYQADGTVMNIQGVEGSGIHVNDYPIVATNDGTSDNSLSKSRWSVDLVSSTFSVAEVDGATTKNNQEEIDGGTDRIAFIQCSQDIIQNVVSGAAQMVRAAGNLDYNTVDSQNTVNDSPKKAPASIWTIDIQKRVEIRLESSDDDSEQEKNQWINMFVDAPSMKLPLGPSSEIQCDGLVIGPSSHGNITISVPAMRQLQGDRLLYFNGPISTIVESSTVAQDLMNFLSSFSKSLGDTPEEMTQVKKDASSNVSFAGLPISLDIPEMNFAILEPSMQLAVERIKAEETTLNVSSFKFNDRNGTCVSLSELSATLLPTLQVSAKQVDTLKLPGIFSLTKPLKNPAVMFGEDSSIDVKLTTIDGILLNPVGVVESTTSTAKPGFNLTFPVSLSIHKLALQKEGEENAQKAEEKDKLFMSAQKIGFSVCPDTNKSSEVKVSKKVQSDIDLSINLHLGKFENQILQVHEMKATMSMNPNDLSKVKNLDLALNKPIKIHSGYSTVEWSQMFQIKKKTPKTTGNSKPTLLPNANISPLQLQISADYKVIAQKDTTVGLSAFHGDSSTTSEDLIKYYSDKVKKQAPGMITHTEVLGANVVDTSLATYGVYALRSGAYGGAAVGLISVVGVDGVFGTLKAGRKSRGGADDESYEAGDFIRGLGYNIKEATKAGGAKRKTKSGQSSSVVTADEDKGSLVDFTVGATTGAIEYADKNKARLGGAGAAGVGMVVGTMFGGPIGGIAGGVFAGAATGKSIEGLEKKFSKGSSKSDEEKLEAIEDENQDSTIEQTNNRAVTAAGPPPTSISESVREELELQTPQGLLYKQRDTFQTQWRPRLFVLHLDSQVLGYHFLSENVPPIVDTNKFNIFNKPALKEPDSSGNPVGFEAVPRGILHLPGCRVEVNEKLARPAKNLFTFTVTPRDGGNDSRPWNLAATTEEARLMWVGMLAEMSGQIEDVKKLAEVCGVSD